MKTAVITGAAGFLGRAIVTMALQDQRFSKVIAADVVRIGQSHEKLIEVECDLSSPKLLEHVAEADVVFHLAATLGATAEADPKAAQRVNVDATLALLAACKAETRFVYASSLAVLGASSDARKPVMIYGAQKAMAEIAIETATLRGEIDGISLRSGGIVARAGMDAGLKSAFLSQVFWAIRDGVDITLPVTQQGSTWLASVENVAQNFMHAATALEIGEQRSLTLPMLRCEFGKLVEVLRSVYPNSASQVRFEPQDDIMRIFGNAQSIDFTDSIAAGFRADVDLLALVHGAFEQGE